MGSDISVQFNCENGYSKSKCDFYWRKSSDDTSCRYQEHDSDGCYCGNGKAKANALLDEYRFEYTSNLDEEKRKDNEIDALKRVLVEMTHHEGAVEETKSVWLPIVQDVLKGEKYGK